MIVYGAWPAWGVPDFSPACLKLKTYLRFAGIPYEARRGDPRRAPKGKIPYIELSPGELMGDSGFIVEYLKKTRGDTLDKDLSAKDHALGHAARRVVEDSLYWVVLYQRWFDDTVLSELAANFAVVMPPVIGGLIFRMIRGQSQKSARAQGMGRHTPAEVHAIGRADLECLSQLLGDKPYLLGDAPTSYDATLFAQLANVMAFPKASPTAVRARELGNLVAYCDRIRAQYWTTEDTLKS